MGAGWEKVGTPDHSTIAITAVAHIVEAATQPMEALDSKTVNTCPSPRSEAKLIL